MTERMCYKTYSNLGHFLNKCPKISRSKAISHDIIENCNLRINSIKI